jgi:hypothetical protein
VNPRRAVLVCVLVATLPALGCPGCIIIGSPSDSLADSSKSIGGAFDGISTSSGSTVVSLTPNRQGFQRDLRAFTAQFAATPGGSRDQFLRGVARIAEDHGVSDWESDAATPRAIGEGLRDAKLSQRQMDAFVDGIGRERPEAQIALDGYQHPGS